jgi:hypothetical protein
MSLRENIQNIIYMKIGGKEKVGITWNQTTEITNEIILLIERRLDNKITHIKTNEDGTQKDKFFAELINDLKRDLLN